MDTKIETRPSYGEIYQGLIDIDRTIKWEKEKPSDFVSRTNGDYVPLNLQLFLEKQNFIDKTGMHPVIITTQWKWFISRYEEKFGCFPIGKWKYQYEDYPFIFAFFALIVSIIALIVSIFKN